MCSGNDAMLRGTIGRDLTSLSIAINKRDA
jgi:hypothetical protein